MSYDSWKTTEPDDRYNPPSRISRLQCERIWWMCFHQAKRKGEAEAYLAEYDGSTIYAVLVEDAKRLLESEAMAVGK